MRNEFTSVIEQDGDWFIGYCPEIPGANGQGRTIEECRTDLSEAIALIPKTGLKMAYAEPHPTRFGKRLLFNETQFFAAPPA